MLEITILRCFSCYISGRVVTQLELFHLWNNWSDTGPYFPWFFLAQLCSENFFPSPEMNSTEDLISEYRVYVVDGEIRAICHYKGPEDTRSWKKKRWRFFPRGSMYGIFTYIWLIFMINVGEYTIHGSYGFGVMLFFFWGKPFVSLDFCRKKAATPW